MGRRPSARKPSFMKILLEDVSKKLLIPSKFVGLHRGTLGRKCILRPTGTQDAWSVSTKQINNLLYFKEGWNEFADHHSLGFGDLLVFRYAGDCEFHVDMFDKSCCFKDPVTFQNFGSRMDSTPILSCQGKNAYRKTRALEAAEEFMSSSKFPAFIKIMQWGYVRASGWLPLKADFGRMHLKESTSEVKIEVSGTTWTVGVKREGYPYRYKLSSLWSYLAKECALKVGDICVFELINAEDCTLKLSIFCSTREDKTWQIKAKSGMALEAHSSLQALDAANKFSSLSKYPSYSCVMHYHYMDARYQHVPTSFVKEMNTTEGGNKVKLQCRGREWDAEIDIHGISAKISNGWPSFAEQNILHFGDVCVLELMNRKDGLIRVTIFRCTR